MGSATSRTLEIEGMSGDVCVTKVRSALKGVHDVSTESVKVGGATIKADEAGCRAACAAIDHAGYPAHEAGCADGNKSDCGKTRTGTGSMAGSGDDSTEEAAPGNAQKAQGHNRGNQSPNQNPSRQTVGVANSGGDKNAVRPVGNTPANPGMGKN